MNSLSLDIWVTFFLNNISFTSFSQKSICGLYHLFYFVFNMSKELEKKKKRNKTKEHIYKQSARTKVKTK